MGQTIAGKLIQAGVLKSAMPLRVEMVWTGSLRLRRTMTKLALQVKTIGQEPVAMTSLLLCLSVIQALVTPTAKCSLSFSHTHTHAHTHRHSSGVLKYVLQ